MSASHSTDAARPAPRIVRAFTEHPASVDETYLQHAAFALGFSGQLFRAAFAALVHAVFPALFQTTASGIIRRLHGRIVSRH